MASVPSKKVPKTYSRQKRSLYDEEPPIKRRRVERAVDAAKADSPISHLTGTQEDDCKHPPVSSEPLTSSPKTSPAVWSDEAPRSSPPSSPVPTSSPPPLQRRRPVFSLFRKQAKKHSTSKQPLSERSDNDARSPPAALPVKTKPKHMVQMQLDLASESRKACKTCGMEYIPSNAEDAALHRKFHAMNVGGVDFTKATVDRLRNNQVWSGGDGSFIAAIGRKDALALRNKTSDVLYIRGHKCIGVCLAERIWEAYTVLAQDDASAQTRKLAMETKSSSISISTATTPALLGISRIWTSNQRRKQGIASRLLDCARSDFLYGWTVEKEQVAFSQPTESGGNLARKWFGREDGWHVYID